MTSKAKWEQNEEIQLFREYLRIPTVHPNVDYTQCIEFLKRIANDLKLDVQIHHPAPERPLIIMSWVGTNPELPSIVLNSHMDVVPVYEESWTHKPFAADIDAEGRIFARGAQDMKCVGMQYLAAIRALKRDEVQYKRTIHLMFVPDEEIGGILGMKIFVKTDAFKALNIGFSLDEGIASPTDDFSVFYGERSIWHIHFKCPGQTGHGSLLHKNTAGEKIRVLLDRFLDFRAVEVRRLEEDPTKTVGDVTTVNVTQIHGGVQSNVVPPSITLVMDIRLAVDVDHVQFEKMLQSWCEEAGGGIEWEFEQKNPKVDASDVTDANPYWVAFKSAIDELNLKTKLQIFPGGTDSRYIRETGIQAIGFSPMNNTPVLLHDNDEFLKADIYLRGIEIYKKIIPKVANA